jgi:hypothetical protein
VNEIWEDRGLDPDSNIDKKQTKDILTEYIYQLDSNVSISQDAFNKIFDLLNTNDAEEVSKEEIQKFILNINE